MGPACRSLVNTVSAMVLTVASLSMAAAQQGGVAAGGAPAAKEEPRCGQPGYAGPTDGKINNESNDGRGPGATTDIGGPGQTAGRGAPVLAYAEPVGAGGPGADGAAVRPPQPESATRDRSPGAPCVIAAQNGKVPEDIKPLPLDLFTSKDFYEDRELWSNPLYFRCNSPMALESQWGAYGTAIIGDNPPGSGAWGFCDRDYPREAIVSPYAFKTAKEHYEALLTEAKAKGGPSQHSWETMPDWSGRYQENNAGLPQWFHMNINQTSTILSLLTPEYQKRAVQDHYHQANTNAAQWPSQYCWPEGLLRWWSQPAVRTYDLIMHPARVQWHAGVADNFMRQIQIGATMKEDGAIPRLGQDVPRWYGETVGFWDGDALISWTSNVQGWRTHSAFEHSNQLQVVEIYTPRNDAQGKFLGVEHESIFYDPEALVQPVRMVRFYEKMGDLNKVDPYVFIECVQTIYPVAGRATPLTPGATYEAEVLDMFGRPWAHIWEKYWETGMKRPEEGEGLFGFD